MTGNALKDIEQIEASLWEAADQLRSNFFDTRTVPCELWHLDRGKPRERRDQVLMIDARNTKQHAARQAFAPLAARAAQLAQDLAGDEPVGANSFAPRFLNQPTHRHEPMPRDDLLKGRFSCPGHVYHVTTCTEARAPLFRDFSCGRLVVKEMRNLDDGETLTSLAWVIMPDHVHWLFQLGPGLTLSQAMKGFKASSALTINRFLNRRGPVWQRGFHDHALRREEDLRTVARYIIGNPLRAGLVQHIGDYPLWDAIWL